MIDKPTISSYTEDLSTAEIVMTAENGVIYYTLDGTEPSASSIRYMDKIEYPTNKLIRAIAISDNEISEISEYQCGVPITYYRYRDALVSNSLIVTTKLDFLNRGKYIDLPKKGIMFSADGQMSNLGDRFYVNEVAVYPPGLDFDTHFVNCLGSYSDFTKYVKWKKGQLLTVKAVLKQFDGITWHDLQQIYSGTYSTKPTVENNNIPVGFAYFCTDKQTVEGQTNGIMIYHKGNDIWVDALGRVVQ